MRVAIIGAGLAGATTARTLVDAGADVVVFDKSRGVGGRMATRRAPHDAAVTFDHGAQYFTARDPRFAERVAAWYEQGLVARLAGPIAVFEAAKAPTTSSPKDRWVGVPTMTAVCKRLLHDVEVRRSTRITRVGRQADAILLGAEEVACGAFDRVVVAVPAAQAAALLEDEGELHGALAKVRMRPCWAVMASFEAPLGVDWGGAFIHDSPVSWAARGAPKPGRANTETLVVHGSAAWSETNLQRAPSDVASQLLAAFFEATGLPPREPSHLAAHRWRYAIPADDEAPGVLHSSDGRIVACGDWAVQPRVEGAFIAGLDAAARVLAG